jgi:hypothetical protein
MTAVQKRRDCPFDVIEMCDTVHASSRCGAANPADIDTSIHRFSMQLVNQR